MIKHNIAVKAQFEHRINNSKYFYKYQEQVEELQGIIDAINNPDLTLGKIFALNFLYE